MKKRRILYVVPALCLLVGALSISARMAEPVEEGAPPESIAAQVFTDVSDGDWFCSSVAYMYEQGLMNGMTPDTFVPALPTTRGMLVTILWRAAGEPAAQSPSTFADVPAERYYSAAVSWAAGEGIVTGYGGVFAPEDPITREQLCVLLRRYTQYRGTEASGPRTAELDSFQDADTASRYAIPALQWACREGVMEGTNDGRLAPRASASRAETAKLLATYFTLFGM